MFKRLFLILIYIICVLLPVKALYAEKSLTGPYKFINNNSNISPLPDDCPSDTNLENNQEWIEHYEEWDDSLDIILETHFSFPLSTVKPKVYLNLIPVYVDRGMGVSTWRELVWAVTRTNQTNYVGYHNCHVIGMTAYYVEGQNVAGWPPDIRFLKNPQNEKKWLNEGAISLIELRWYDAVEKKRHRWFNNRLAFALDWVGGYYYSPILLPMTINTLN